LRIAIVVLSIFGGLGLVAYASGLMLMPRDGMAEMPIRRFLPFTRNWSTGAVIAATAAVAVAVVALVGFNGIGFGPLAVIFCIWFFGFRGRNQRMAPPAPPEPTPFERAAENWRQRLAEQQAPGYENVALAAPAETRWSQPYTDPATDLAVRDDDLPVPLAAGRARRPRNWRLWLLAFGLVGAAVTIVAVLGTLGFPTSPLAYSGAVLAALGTSLLIATRRGRPPLLLPATLVAAAVTGGMMMSANHLAVPSVGEIHRVYTTGAQMPAELTLSAGELTVDLSKLDLSADQDLTVHVGTGQVNLKVPDGVNTELDWKVKLGEFNSTVGSTGEGQGGADLNGANRYPATDPAAPTLHVTVSVDLGELDVTE
jgi:hypothetical protein